MIEINHIPTIELHGFKEEPDVLKRAAALRYDFRTELYNAIRTSPTPEQLMSTGMNILPMRDLGEEYITKLYFNLHNFWTNSLEYLNDDSSSDLRDRLSKRNITEVEFLKRSIGSELMSTSEVIIFDNLKNESQSLSEAVAVKGTQLYVPSNSNVAEIYQNANTNEVIRNGVTYHVEEEESVEDVKKILQIYDELQILPGIDVLSSGLFLKGTNKASMGLYFRETRNILVQLDRNARNSLFDSDFDGFIQTLITFTHEIQHAKQKPIFQLIRELDAFQSEYEIAVKIVKASLGGKFNNTLQPLDNMRNRNLDSFCAYLNRALDILASPDPEIYLFANHNIRYTQNRSTLALRS